MNVESQTLLLKPILGRSWCSHNRYSKQRDNLPKSRINKNNKKRSGQRKNRNNTAVAVTRFREVNQHPFPERISLAMKYCTQFLATSGAIGQPTLANVFRMNSIFDPDVNNTGSNHQPYGHDTYSNIYARYRVMAFAYKAEISNTNVAATVPGVVSICPSLVNGFSNTQDLVGEAPFSKTVLATQTQSTIRQTIDLVKFYGMTRQQYLGDDSTESIFGSTPSTVSFLNIQMSNPTTTTASSAVINLELIYYVDLFEPITLSQS